MTTEKQAQTDEVETVMPTEPRLTPSTFSGAAPRCAECGIPVFQQGAAWRHDLDDTDDGDHYILTAHHEASPR